MAYPDQCTGNDPCPFILRVTSGKALSSDCPECGGTWPEGSDAYRPGPRPERAKAGRRGGRPGAAEPAPSDAAGENDADRGPTLPQDASQASG